MKVFITGASGYIGTEVTKNLLAAGHSVVGLARSDESADKLTTLGAEVCRGDLSTLDVIREAAVAADGVIHLAFIHDFNNFQASADADQAVIETIGEALVGSDKPFVVASGTAGLAPGRLAIEKDNANPESPRASERASLPFAEQGVRVSILRLPPTVHGQTDAHGFIPVIIDVARDKKVSGYPADGTNRWAAVNVADAADLFRLALESAPAGAILHAIGEEAITTKEIAEVIGAQLQLPVDSIEADAIAGHYGWIGAFFSMDIPALSAVTQQTYNWHPSHPGLIDDLNAGFYFS